MHININKSGQDNAVWDLTSEDIQTMELEDAKKYAVWCEDLETDYENEIDDMCSDKSMVHNRLDMLQERCRELEAEKETGDSF